MRVTVFMREGDRVVVASHSIPEMRGTTTTTEGHSAMGLQSDSGSETTSDLDDVQDVEDVLTFSPAAGGTLERVVRKYTSDGTRRVAYANHSKGDVVITPEEAARAFKVLVDGVQVWPVEEDALKGVSDALDRIDGLQASLG